MRFVKEVAQLLENRLRETGRFFDVRVDGGDAIGHKGTPIVRMANGCVFYIEAKSFQLAFCSTRA